MKETMVTSERDAMAALVGLKSTFTRQNYCK